MVVVEIILNKALKKVCIEREDLEWTLKTVKGWKEKEYSIRKQI